MTALIVEQKPSNIGIIVINVSTFTEYQLVEKRLQISVEKN